MSQSLQFYNKYEEDYRRPDGYFDPLVKDILQYLEPKPRYRILDIGCGYGDFLNSFRKHLGDRAEYFGVTLANHEYEFIRSTYPFISIQLSNQTQLGDLFRNQPPMDIVINFHTLSYLQQDEQIEVMRNQILQLLSPSGILVLGLIDSWIQFSSRVFQSGPGYTQFYYSPGLFFWVAKSNKLVRSFIYEISNYRIQFWKKKERSSLLGLNGIILVIRYFFKNWKAYVKSKIRA